MGSFNRSAVVGSAGSGMALGAALSGMTAEGSDAGA